MSSAIDSLTIEEIAQIFQESNSDSEFVLPATDPDFLEAAVFILLVREEEQWKMLLTRRTDTVRDHKGQVSFPGGAREETDTSIQETALRETCEEIGVDPKDITFFGRLTTMKSVSSYIITPFVGYLPWPYPLKLAESEVSRVFLIPLNWLEESCNWEVEWFTGLPDGIRRQVIRYHPYDGEILWGISAYFAQQVIRIIKQHTRE